MFAHYDWTRRGRRLALLLVLAAVVLYAAGAIRFWNSFPGSYVWSELLISYEGGPVRRGLLGEIGFLLHDALDVRTAFTGLFWLLYVAIAVRYIVLATGNLNFPGLLFLLSPATLAFPLYDSGAFGRKDAIILAAFLAALAIVRRFAERPNLAFALVVLTYIPASLIHELALLYLPAAVAFLLHTAGRDRGRGWVATIVGLSIGVVLLGAALSIAFKGTAELEAQMVGAWQARVPGAFEPLYAADYLSEGFLLTLAMIVSQTFADVTVGGYLICAFLGGLPVLAYVLERPPAVSDDPVRRGFLMLAVAAMLTTFLLASDWGRLIHLFWMHAFAFVASIATSRRAAPQPLLPSPDRDLKTFAYLVALFFLYVFTWRMGHAVQRENPLWPGLIFELQPRFCDVFSLPPIG